jgi:hypothetical protein
MENSFQIQLVTLILHQEKATALIEQSPYVSFLVIFTYFIFFLANGIPKIIMSEKRNTNIE